MHKAVFLDRDGTIISLAYDKDTGYIDSVTRPEQVRLIDGVVESLHALKSAGYRIFLVSNQPAIAKGRVDEDTFWKTQRLIDDSLKSMGVEFDGEYFCLHHPNAVIEKYRVNCNCRKPKPGLIIKAAQEHNIDLPNSYMIGDDIMDVEAAINAGCKAVLISHVTGLLIQILEEKKLKPDAISSSLKEAVELILSNHI